jgi:PQQ-dependent dehydrogenase (methanol/ethanol family)
LALWASQYNRGVAVDRRNVYIASGDCRLFAVNRITGKLVWEAKPCDPTQAIGINGAPRVGDGMVFIGNTGGDASAVRGHVDAYDAATGRHLWRFYTVPGNPADGFENPAMKMASQTWPANYWRNSGGGSPWGGMTYDARLHRLYAGVGNPGPISQGAPETSKYNKLFTNSIVALDGKTGKLLWYYQEASGGSPCDCDGTAQIQIANLPTSHGRRRVVMQAGKDGFFYVIDAHTGRLLSANNYVPNNWASRVDPATGRLEFRAHWQDETVRQPGSGGAHAWIPMAYSPHFRLVYVPAYVWPEPSLASKSQQQNGDLEFGDMYYGLSPTAKIRARGELIAWDPVAQRERWHVDDPLPLNGGVLATAGNLVFEGTADGFFNAYDAQTGKLLWKFDVHGATVAAPITVQIDGEQLILVPSGDGSATASVQLYPKLAMTPNADGLPRLLAFRLGGRGSVPPAPARIVPRPFRPLQPAALARRGAGLFEGAGCFLCHGEQAYPAGRAVPDLRTVSRATYDAMPAIVIHGAFVQGGMPAFPDLSLSDIEAIQAYLTNQAWAAYDSQQTGKTQSQLGQ